MNRTNGKRKRGTTAVVPFPEVETLDDLLALNRLELRLISAEEFENLVRCIETHLPRQMDKCDVEIVRGHRRLIKNRESAKLSRDRKRAKATEQQKQIEVLQDRLSVLEAYWKRTKELPEESPSSPDVFAYITQLEHTLQTMSAENESLRDCGPSSFGDSGRPCSEMESLSCFMELEHLQTTVDEIKTVVHKNGADASVQTSRVNAERRLHQEKTDRLERIICEQGELIDCMHLQLLGTPSHNKNDLRTFISEVCNKVDRAHIRPSDPLFESTQMEHPLCEYIPDSRAIESIC